MSQVSSPQRLNRIDIATKGLDRAQILRILGVDSATPIVGDFTDLHCVSSEAARPIKIHSDNVPFLETGSGLENCAGALLQKWGHSVVAVPCFSVEINIDSHLCDHCTEMWRTFDADKCFRVDGSMGYVKEKYRPGEQKTIKKWMGYLTLKDHYHDMITEIKDAFEDTPHKLDTK